MVSESTPYYYDDILKIRVPVVYSPRKEPNIEGISTVVDDMETGKITANTEQRSSSIVRKGNRIHPQILESGSIVCRID